MDSVKENGRVYEALGLAHMALSPKTLCFHIWAAVVQGAAGLVRDQGAVIYSAASEDHHK